MKHLVFACLLLASPLWSQSIDPQDLKARFAKTMQVVDRVVVRIGEHGGADPGTEVVFDHNGSDKIQGFLDRFEPDKIDGYCMCLGDALVEFFNGDEFVSSFTIHHNQMLRGDGSIWSGDLYFQEGAMEQFLRHFDSLGYRGFSQKIAEGNSQQKQADQDWQKLLNQFPEELRHLIPRGLTIEERVNTRQQAEALKLAWGETPDALLAIWRTLATRASKSGVNAMRYSRQPYRTLLHCLELFSAGTQSQALSQLLESSDPLLGSGAGLYFLILNAHHDDWKPPLGIALKTRMIEDLFSLASTSRAEGEIIEGLLDCNQIAIDNLLLSRLSAAHPSSLGRKEGLPPYLVDLVLTLAERNHPQLQPILENLLNNGPEEIQRLALEVGIALIDSTRSDRIGEPHLLSDSYLITSAATKVIQRQSRQLPIELLSKMAAYPVNSIDGPGTIEFFSPSSAKEWAREELAKQGLAPFQIQESAEKSPQEKVAEAKLRQGKYEEAHENYRTLFRDRQDPFNEIKAMLGSGRIITALLASDLQVSRSSTNAPVSGRLAFRGFVNYANGWYLEAAKDFAATSRLGHTNPQWMRVMEQLSRRNSADPPQPKSIQENSDQTQAADFRLVWPSAALQFLAGQISEEELLDTAGANLKRRFPNDISNLTQANWILAELARLEGNLPQEKAYLQQILILGDYEQETHLLAHLRARELRWTSQSQNP